MVDENSRFILSVNAGSSSLKISLYVLPSPNDQSQGNEATHEPVSFVLTSSISNITAPPAQFAFELADPPSADDSSHTNSSSDAIGDHASAFHYFLHELDSQTSIKQKNIVYTCHRVVHGGDYSQPITITKSSYNHIEKLSDLAPLYALLHTKFASDINSPEI